MVKWCCTWLLAVAVVVVSCALSGPSASARVPYEVVPLVWGQIMDSDGDGISDMGDACPFDRCNHCVSDKDMDTVMDDVDTDIDGDGIVNGVDPDIDNDGIPNGFDVCPDGANFACGFTSWADDTNFNCWIDSLECTWTDGGSGVNYIPFVCFWRQNMTGIWTYGVDVWCEHDPDRFGDMPCECQVSGENSNFYNLSTSTPVCTLPDAGLPPTECGDGEEEGGGGGGGDWLEGDCCWEVGEDMGDGEIMVDDDDDDNDGVPDVHDECPRCKWDCEEECGAATTIGGEPVCSHRTQADFAETFSGTAGGHCKCEGCPINPVTTSAGSWGIEVTPGKYSLRCLSDSDYDDDGLLNTADHDCGATCHGCTWCGRVADQADIAWELINVRFDLAGAHAAWAAVLETSTIPTFSIPIPGSFYGKTMPQTSIVVDLDPYLGTSGSSNPLLTSGLWLFKKVLLAILLLQLFPKFITALKV